MHGFLAIISGIVVGALLALFGGGGSVLATPLLIYLVGVRDPHVAIGTSALAVSANALMNLAAHARAGRVKWPCALVFGGAGLAGSFFGSSIAKHIDGQRLLIYFAGAMCAIAISMLVPKKSDGDPDVVISWRLLVRLAPVGLIVGTVAGFFGIGGGFLIVPGLMMATGMTLANASASSLMSVALFGAATSANYALSGMVDLGVAALFVLGGVMGSVVGMRGAALLQSRAALARRIFAVLIILVALYIAYRATVQV